MKYSASLKLKLFPLIWYLSHTEIKTEYMSLNYVFDKWGCDIYADAYII